ncbi:MAG TPA: DNA methyltransferase [Acidobacteriaceae bacterium]|nr:DNA methyltransferase [Acidobacteriaceae bacterium]
MKEVSAHPARAETWVSSALAESLAAVDWTFPERGRGHDIESLHPYPAKFISEIPSAILDSLRPPAHTLVFDPFCGSGTTLLAAQKRGLPSVGVDLNPIACLISRVKTSPTPFGLEADAVAILEEARNDTNPAIPAIPNLDHWFEPSVQIAVAGLVAAIARRIGSPTFDTLRLALSSILVRVSNQDSDTRYAAVVKDVGAEHTYRTFKAAVAKLAKALEERSWATTACEVIESDVLAVKPEAIVGRVGVVITSPPYPNAYEYWLYHKYRMWWLGFDPLAVKAAEIGARAHFFKRDRHTEGHFREQMRGVFALIDAVLEPGGVVCFIVGRSKIHGVTVDNAETVRDVGEEAGLLLETRIERVIAQGRKSFNLSHANIKTESVVVLRKP